MKKIEAVIFDWAGTTVDFGCFAPVNVFIDIFKDAGIEVTMAEAREPMGMLKIDHIRAMLSMPRIACLWEEENGKPFTETDVERLYSKFEPALLQSLAHFTDPIAGVVETVKELRANGLKIGSTTGYTSTMMDIVVPLAKEKGYTPDCYFTADDTDSYGRPYPFMIFKNLQALKVSSVKNVVKVGDTISDMKEGAQAGVWTVGVIVGSSEMGLSANEFNKLSEEEQRKEMARTKEAFISAGADFTIETMTELPSLIETINLQGSGKEREAIEK